MEYPIISKLQFEIRYYAIINFTSFIRKLLNPFARFAESLSITTPSKHNEIFKFESKEDRFVIDIRWDRMIIVTQGQFDEFNSVNFKPMKLFFDIFHKINTHDEFLNVTNYLLIADLVRLTDDDNEKLLSDFVSRNIIDANNKKIGKYTDCAIILEKEKDDEVVKIIKGPFSKKDIERRDLFPFEKNDRDELYAKNGFTENITILRKKENFAPSDFISLINDLKSYTDI